MGALSGKVATGVCASECSSCAFLLLRFLDVAFFDDVRVEGVSCINEL